MRVAVTGGSGFVGGAVCRALVEQGCEVLAYGRRVRVAAERVGGAPYRSWDITYESLGDAPEVDAVVHCAGTVTDWGPIEEFFTTNVNGTKNVLASFPGARFVHVSTASVYDPYRPTVMAAEDRAPVHRYLNGYGASKAAAERAVLASGARAIILRPHAVYGPGDTTILPRILSAVRGGVLFGVGDGRQRISVTRIGNLVQACLLAVRGPVDHGIFNITDAEPITLDHALRSILRERGVNARPAYLPLRAVWPLASAIEGTFLLVKSRRPPRLTRYALSHLAVERTLDLTAARERLGYTPAPTSFAGAADW
jgi:nucleoside-diphosphate-sugar epimerase